MEIKGKKINFLGDSITEGVGTSCKENMYVNIIAEKYGAICRNYGISGTEISRQIGMPYENCQDFCKRYQTMDDDADIVVVFGGTNDYGHGNTPLGEMSDRTVYTFYGACHTLFEGLLNKYPESQIIILTPFHRLNEDDPRAEHVRDFDTAPLKVYKNIIKEVAEYYSLPVLDIYANSGVQPAVDIMREKYMPDGLHPNDKGNEIIVRMLTKFIENL